MGFNFLNPNFRIVKNYDHSIPDFEVTEQDSAFIIRIKIFKLFNWLIYFYKNLQNIISKEISLYRGIIT